MAANHTTASGLTWSTQSHNVNLIEGHRERLKFANITQLPESGLFAEELAAVDPDIQAVGIDVEGNVDLTGIESMPHLVHLLIHRCQKILPSSAPPTKPLNLTRVLMPYSAGVTEELIASPRLRNLEVDGGSLDMLNDLSESHIQVQLRGVKSASDHSDWGQLGNVTEFEIVQSGKIEVLPPQDRWPMIVNFTTVSSLQGLVQASQIQPFRFVGLEGIRTMDPTASIWDLQANDALISFNAKPPKWLIEAWDDRPDDWANTFRLPYHRLLPGSDDQDWSKYDTGYVEDDK